ncbi:hypothetical protein MPC4_50059 [Methylocella tundrae]|uniref:Uncharacterized protein n=1 Tax=Methylocella tundrae TaxID=227605 RepID=A0A8B6MAI1_METTU|nr:hypothetical protein MPC1_5610003 [Methylocella tundrae]VTZ51751.1 hypothetical protein MPC4_50059 [Methylocella tundrae]
MRFLLGKCPLCYGCMLWLRVPLVAKKRKLFPRTAPLPSSSYDAYSPTMTKTSYGDYRFSQKSPSRRSGFMAGSL